MRKALFILGQLNDSDMEWLIQNGHKRRVAARQVVIQEGRHVDTLSFVLDGVLAVTISALKDKEIATLSAGEIIGEVSFVDSRPPSATVLAKTDAVLWDVPRKTLQQHLDRDAGFAARFNRAISVFLADRLRKTISRLGFNSDDDIDEDVEYADEIDPAVLDKVAIAGRRFDRMLQQLAAD